MDALAHARPHRLTHRPPHLRPRDIPSVVDEYHDCGARARSDGSAPDPRTRPWRPARTRPGRARRPSARRRVLGRDRSRISAPPSRDSFRPTALPHLARPSTVWRGACSFDCDSHANALFRAHLRRHAAAAATRARRSGAGNASPGGLTARGRHDRRGSAGVVERARHPARRPSHAGPSVTRGARVPAPARLSRRSIASRHTPRVLGVGLTPGRMHSLRSHIAECVPSTRPPRPRPRTSHVLLSARAAARAPLRPGDARARRRRSRTGQDHPGRARRSRPRRPPPGDHGTHRHPCGPERPVDLELRVRTGLETPVAEADWLRATEATLPRGVNAWRLARPSSCRSTSRNSPRSCERCRTISEPADRRRGSSR